MVVHRPGTGRGYAPRGRARRHGDLLASILVLSCTLAGTAAIGTQTALATSRRPALATDLGGVGRLAAGPFSGATPVRVVILADESGSITDVSGAVQGERQAASLIVQGEWSAKSQIAVYGFGSAPSKHNIRARAALDPYCGLTELSGEAARAALTRCAGEITPRTAAQGDNTDFAAALGAARDLLATPDPLHRVPIVFLLTDGILDVGQNSPYGGQGTSDAMGNRNAAQLLATRILPALSSLGAQIWPIGFGDANRNQLNKYAGAGAHGNPECPSDSGGTNIGGTPKVTIVPPGDAATETRLIEQALLGAFATARCGALQRTPAVTLQPGSSVTVPVSINSLATFGSIFVTKGDPRVEVTYADPDGHTVSDNTTAQHPSGVLDGADYALTSGGTSGVPNDAVESLRLDNPVTGTWRVTLTNPPGVGRQQVSVSVVWQGRIQADLILSPQVADPGQPLRIGVQPVVRSAPLPDGTLAGLRVDVTVGWGPAGTQHRVPTTLNGQGEFVGTILVPRGLTGTALIRAFVRGHGVQGTTARKVPVVPGGSLEVGLAIPRGIRVAPGGTVSATARVSNEGLPANRITFALNGLNNGVNAWIASPTRPVPVGSGRRDIAITIRFGRQTRLGPALGTIEWAEARPGSNPAAGSAALHPAGYLDVVVEPPPGPLIDRWWVRALIALALALAITLLVILPLMRRRARGRRRRNLQYVDIALIRPGRGDDHDHYVPPLPADGFTGVRWFENNAKSGTGPVLGEVTEPQAGALELRRYPADSTLLLTVVGAGQNADATDSAEPIEAPVGRPFDPPSGAPWLDRCRLIIRERPPGTPPEEAPDHGGRHDSDHSALYDQRMRLDDEPGPEPRMTLDDDAVSPARLAVDDDHASDDDKRRTSEGA